MAHGPAPLVYPGLPKQPGTGKGEGFICLSQTLIQTFRYIKKELGLIGRPYHTLSFDHCVDILS